MSRILIIEDELRTALKNCLEDGGKVVVRKRGGPGQPVDHRTAGNEQQRRKGAKSGR